MRSLTTAVRYGLPAALTVAGVTLAIAGQGKDTAMERGSRFVALGLSVVVLSLLIRYGVSGDLERDAEEAARQHLDDPGHWPDEPLPTSRRALPSAIADEVPAGNQSTHNGNDVPLLWAGEAVMSSKHANVAARRTRDRSLTHTARYPQGAVDAAHVFTNVAVSGICVA